MDPTTQLLPFPLPSLTPFHRLICFLWAMVSASLHPNIFAGWRSVAEVSTYRLFEAQGKDTVPVAPPSPRLFFFFAPLTLMHSDSYHEKVQIDTRVY